MTVIGKTRIGEFSKRPCAVSVVQQRWREKKIVGCGKVLSVPHPIKVLSNLVENSVFRANLIIINRSRWMRQNLIKFNPSATERKRRFLEILSYREALSAKGPGALHSPADSTSIPGVREHVWACGRAGIPRRAIPGWEGRVGKLWGSEGAGAPGDRLPGQLGATEHKSDSFKRPENALGGRWK